MNWENFAGWLYGCAGDDDDDDDDLGKSLQFPSPESQIKLYKALFGRISRHPLPFEARFDEVREDFVSLKIMMIFQVRKLQFLHGLCVVEVPCPIRSMGQVYILYLHYYIYQKMPKKNNCSSR